VNAPKNIDSSPTATTSTSKMVHLGFSQRLLSKIIECNTAVENWVQREKQAADEMEAEFRRTLVKEQSSIDSLEEDLLAVRFKLGMAIKDDRGLTDGSHDGIVQKQEQMLQEKAQVQIEMANLRSDRAKKEKEIKST
jgi:hypothetical protein